MPNTFKAPFIQNSFSVDVALTAITANPTSDAPTGTIVLATGGANGSVIFDLKAVPKATPSANTVTLYIANSTGTVIRYKDSVSIATTAVSALAANPEYPFTKWTKDNPLFLNQGQQLRAGLGAAFASGIVVSGTQGDF